DVRMDVAVAGMAEAGDAQAVLPLEPCGKGKQVLQPAAGDDDILVQLGQAGIAQGVRELLADLPHGFAFLLAEADLHEQGLLVPNNSLKLPNLATHGLPLAVELD